MKRNIRSSAPSAVGDELVDLHGGRRAKDYGLLDERLEDHFRVLGVHTLEFDVK